MKKNWVLRKCIGIAIMLVVMIVAGYGFYFGNFRFNTQEVLAYAKQEIPGAREVIWSKKAIFLPSSVVIMTDYGRRIEFRVTNLFGRISIEEVEIDLMASK